MLQTWNIIFFKVNPLFGKKYIWKLVESLVGYQLCYKTLRLSWRSRLPTGYLQVFHFPPWNRSWKSLKWRASGESASLRKTNKNPHKLNCIIVGDDGSELVFPFLLVPISSVHGIKGPVTDEMLLGVGDYTQLRGSVANGYWFLGK